MQKATFYRLKGHLLQPERRPFATRLIINRLQAGENERENSHALKSETMSTHNLSSDIACSIMTLNKNTNARKPVSYK